MGIATVAVYSTRIPVLFTRCADRAVRLGPPPLSSYLNIEALLHAAAESGAEAVHPGYGFLAENPVFAQAVVDAGMVWIGPPADVIKVMGDKIAAKELALPRCPGCSRLLRRGPVGCTPAP
jgi:acetyl/propionyl-CoA carboxylase alpha subunit